MNPFRFCTLIVVIAASSLLAHGVARSGAIDPDRSRTDSLVAAYERTKGWPVKALALLSLGDRWHPAGSRIVADALRSRDPRLTAYAIEALRSTSKAHLRCILVPDLMDEVLNKLLRERNPRVRLNLILLLARTFPEAEAVSPVDWRGWWRKARETYVADPWKERPTADPAYSPTKTVPAPSILDRAFDLSQGGIQLVMVVDSTGSMQPTIDAVKAGLRDVVAVLSGIASDFELGLVHYRDHADFPRFVRRSGSSPAGTGAQVLAELTPNISKVQVHLDRITAMGGGDLPERVADGLRLAYLHRTMGWEAKANKMVILLGDAPPHAVEDAVGLARKGREEPEAFLGRRSSVVTGPRRRKGPRPFVTSAVAVGTAGPGLVTTRPFRQIAEAGGGVYVAFSTQGDPREVSTDIVRRLIELSFGERYVDEARRLVDVYFTYRDAGFIVD